MAGTLYLNIKEIELLLDGLGHMSEEISTVLEGYNELDDDGNIPEVERLHREEVRIFKMRNKLNKKMSSIQNKVIKELEASKKELEASKKELAKLKEEQAKLS